MPRRFCYLLNVAPSEPFRVGEQVAVIDSYVGFNRLCIIKRITPTGRIRLNDDTTQYTASGYRIGGNSIGNSRRIVRPDAALIAYIEREHFRRLLSRSLEYGNTAGLSIDKLREIAAVLDEPDPTVP